MTMRPEYQNEPGGPMGELCTCRHGHGHHVMHSGVLPEGACGVKDCGCENFTPLIPHKAFDSCWAD